MVLQQAYSYNPVESAYGIEGRIGAYRTYASYQRGSSEASPRNGSCSSSEAESSRSIIHELPADPAVLIGKENQSGDDSNAEIIVSEPAFRFMD